MTEKHLKNDRTSVLLSRLFKARDFEGFAEENGLTNKTPAFHSYISELCRQMDQIPEHIIRQSMIERTYGHQLFNGTRNPSRDKVIQLAFGFGLDVEATQKLLVAAQKSPLYPKIMRDAAVLYSINHKKNILETQDLLQDLGLSLLGV